MCNAEDRVKVLEDALTSVYRVIDSGDWSVVGGTNQKGYMSIDYKSAEMACELAELALGLK